MWRDFNTLRQIDRARRAQLVQFILRIENLIWIIHSWVAGNFKQLVCQLFKVLTSCRNLFRILGHERAAKWVVRFAAVVSVGNLQIIVNLRHVAAHNRHEVIDELLRHFTDVIHGVFLHLIEFVEMVL